MAHNFESKAQKKLIEAWTHDSYTKGVASQQFDWTGVAEIRLRSVVAYDLQEYDWQKVNGSRFGPLIEVEDEVQTLTIEQDYGWNLAIDKRNNTSTLMEKAAGSISNRQVREKLIPQMDMWAIYAWATGRGVQNFGSTGGGIVKENVSLSKSNVLETIMGHGNEMSNKLVPVENRVCFIRKSESLKLKLADQIVGTQATVQDMARRIIKRGELGMVDSTHIVDVPDVYFPDGLLYLIVHRGSVINPVKVSTNRILETHPDIDGAVSQGRYLYDAFVIAKKSNGVLAAWSGAAGGTGATGET